ncbi:MAG TPA: TonB-dependent receptor, partial [Bryobacteraceae bacterium]|nr:TonB-dependent receptor [Bryobacteraceae bacterium]
KSSLLLCAALSFLFAAALNAQVDTGSILGVLKDSSGAVIPQAHVTVTNEGTGAAQTATTNESGAYVVTPLRIGTYTVEVAHPGFQGQRRSGLQLNIQQQLVVDFTLAVGDVANTVDVTAEAPLLQTESGSVGQVIQQQAINNLPLNGRNYTFLARLAPGVTQGQPEGRGLNANGWFEANGTRPAQNNYLLDGIDNNSSSVDFLSGAAYVVKPPIDAISEFKLQTSAFSAEFGRAGGAVLNATLKSGTNGFHGSAWEFLRNDKFDSADFFQNANGQKKGAFRQNQFGVTEGGRIIRNKTFFFADYEGTRIRQQVPKTGYTVPTVAERNSGFTDFSDLIALQSGSRTDALGRSFPLGTIFDPSTTRLLSNGQYVRDPFAGNVIPMSRLDPNAVKLMSLYPAPTQPGLNNNYNINRNNQTDVNAFDSRLDQIFSPKDQLFVRYSLSRSPSIFPPPFDGYADGGGFSDGTQHVDTQGAALSYTHIFGPTLINEARVGFNREHTSRIQAYGNDTSNIPGQFGIQGVPQIPGNGGLPSFGIGGLTQLGPSQWLISDRYSNTGQFTENLTKIYRNHSFKGGFEAQVIALPWAAPPYAKGSFSFSGQYTSVPNLGDGSTGRVQFLLNPVNTQTGVLLGGSDGVSASNFGDVASERNYYGAYLQDDWKITQRLTLNLGVRWDYFSPTGEKYGAQGNFIPAAPGSAQFLIPASRKGDPPLSPAFVSLLQKDGINLVYTDKYGSGLSEVQKTNFAPRFGFAYKAMDKLVVRGGFGIYYGGFENRGGSPSLGYNYPFQYIFSFPAANSVTPVTYPNGTVASIENGISSINATSSTQGLSMRGIQLHYKTPYVMSYNFTMQYQLTGNDLIEASYVGSLSRHLETFVGTNLPSVLLPPGTNPQLYVPFPDFARGSSWDDTVGNAHYNALQTKYERRLAHGLTALATYTWAKTLTDAG